MKLEYILNFLSKLSENNNREWFQEHKNEYEEAKSVFEDLVYRMIGKIALYDKSVSSVVAKDCMFRIYRDVRFSGDKLPYKTNMGAFVSKGGRKSAGAGYYFHIEPQQSMVAGGIYMPPPETLSAIRHAIYSDTERFKKIIGEPSFKKIFGQLDDFNKLKKAPKDYPADFVDIDLLKYKSYFVFCKFSDEDVLNGALEKQTDMLLSELQPFMRFLYEPFVVH